MTVYRLHLRQRPGGAVELYLGYGWRVFFASLTIGIGAMILSDGRVGAVLAATGVLSLFAALYHESWCFDTRADVITARVGLVFWSRRRTYRFSYLSAVLVRSRAQFNPETSEALGKQPLVPKAIQRGYVQLILLFESSPERVIVQTESIRNHPAVQVLAEELSGALDVPVRFSEST